MWVTKLLISPVKKGFFAQKRPNLAQNWHFCPLLAHLVPCWWDGWWLWRAGCISQETYLLYYLLLSLNLENLKLYLPVERHISNSWGLQRMLGKPKRSGCQGQPRVSTNHTVATPCCWCWSAPIG